MLDGEQEHKLACRMLDGEQEHSRPWELVGSANPQHIMMPSLFGGLDRVIEPMPAHQSDLIKDDACCLHWQDAEVASARPVTLPKIVRPPRDRSDAQLLVKPKPPRSDGGCSHEQRRPANPPKLTERLQ
jgi:hypothetical protein